MATSLQIIFTKSFSYIFGPNDNKLPLIKVMVCHKTVDQPLPKEMMNQLNGTYV